MTTKRAIISSVCVMSAAIVLGLAVLFFFVDPSAGGANERAALLGRGLSMLCFIPLIIIWIM